MNPFLFFGGAFVVAVVIAALVSRLSAASSVSHSEEEKQRRREAAIQSEERNRKRMQWIASVMLCILAVVAVVSWFSHDPASKEFGLYIAGALALPFLALWGKTRDDGLNPQLRKKKPNQPSEPTRGSGP